MDYSLPTKAFIGTYFKMKGLSGAEKFIITACSIAQGDISSVILIATITKVWQKSLLKLKYHNSYYTTAQIKDWVKPVGTGKFTVTKNGFDYLQKIAITQNEDPLDNSTKLIIFSAKQSHTFDKLLREIFATATKRIRIADSYVDATIFDNVLDNIPTSVRIELMYGNNPDGAFDARVKRFKQEYKDFSISRHNHLHDRFVIVDDIGFLIGPSIKDAANKSAAIVMRLNKKDSQQLLTFFDTQYKQLTKS